MKKHTSIGWDILHGSTSPILQQAAEIALSHHEKFDGSGYPGGLRGETIPMSGRIVAVADVFDALTSERPYKRAWEISRAVEFLEQGRDSHFDAQCIDAFLGQMNAVLEIRQKFHDDEHA
jgi:putative two-component system response regulator